MADIYIDPSASTNGSGTSSNPYNVWPSSIADGIYVYVKAGTTMTTNISCSSASITITKYGTGTNPLIQTADGTTRLFIITGSNVTIENIDFSTTYDDNSAMGLCLYGENNTAINCNITGGNSGIEGYGGGGGGTYNQITIRDCTITKAVGDGLYISKFENITLSGLTVTNLQATTATEGSTDGVHVVYPASVTLDNCNIDHSTCTGKYCLITTAQNIEGVSNGTLTVTGTTFKSGTNQACVFPALDSAYFTNCTFIGGLRFVQTPANDLRFTNCTFTGTSDLTEGVESSTNQYFTNCLFSNIPTGVTAIINTDAVLSQVTINGVNYNGAYNGDYLNSMGIKIGGVSTPSKVLEISWANIKKIIGVTITSSSGLSLTDDFESYNIADIGGQGNWVDRLNNLAVTSGSSSKVLSSTTLNLDAAACRTEAFTSNHSSQVTLAALVNGYNYIGPCVRCQGAGSYANTQAYYAYYVSAQERYLVKVIDGHNTTIGYVEASNAVGDILRLEVSGTTLKCYLNGALDTALTGGTGIFTDTDIAGGGTPGVASYNYVESVDSWVGADI